MKHYTKTRLFTFALCFVTMIISLLVQLNGQNSLENGCSYLDPVLIDILAFCIGIFLICEGAYRISEHKNMCIRNQFTRSVRMAIGVAIVTIHVLQFIHK